MFERMTTLTTRLAAVCTQAVVVTLCLSVAPRMAPTLYAAEPIFYYVDEGGVMHFADTVKHAGFSRYKKYDATSTPQPEAATQPEFVAYNQPISPRMLEQTIVQAATSHGVDPYLVKAIIRTESNFDPFATSRAGALGLMQLMPETARLMGVANPYNAVENIRGGVSYFKAMLQKFNNDLTIALAAYNAGPTAVLRYRGVPPYPETIRYIKEVLSYYRRLKAVS